MLKDLREIVLVLASPAEWEALSKAMGLMPVHRIFLHKNLRMRVLITGVGMSAMASGLGGACVEKKQESLFINLGLGGCFNPDVPLGSVFRITDEQITEMGAEDGPNIISYPDLGINSPFDWPMLPNGHILSPPFPRSIQSIISVPEAKGITVNRVHGNAESIAGFFPLKDVLVESMEGAAFFMACHRLGLNGIQLRGISNRVEPRNRQAWKIDLAIRTLSDSVLRIIKELK